MGGKTAQRVAGNVKPSSSRRIRELLTNQQQGSSNIITFSALSNRKEPTFEPSSKLEKPSSLKKTIPVEEKGSSIAAEAPKDPTSYRLVVTRVGDRDLYRRVRFCENIGENEAIEPSVKPSEAGVKKPAYLSEASLEVAEKQTHIKSSEEVIYDEDKDQPTQDREDENTDFDTILGRLAQTKAIVDQQSADSVSELNETQVIPELDLIKIFEILVQKFNRDLSIEDWDVIVSAIHKWTTWISRSEHPLRESHQIQFCVEVIDFVNQLISFAKSIDVHDKELSEELHMMQSLLDDWKNFHSSVLFQEILVLYFKLIAIDSLHENKRDQRYIRPLIESLAQIVIDVDQRIVLSHYALLDRPIKDSKIELEPEFELPGNSIHCDVDERKFKGFQAACDLFRSDYRVILVSAHSMLLRTMGSICEASQISSMSSADDLDVDDVPIFPPAPLMSILTSRDSIMSALLSDYRVGDISVTIEPDTDSYVCTLAYLFSWDLTIQFIVGMSNKEIGHRMIHSFKKLGLIQRLLDTIFVLLPPLGERDSLKFKIESNPNDKTPGHQDQPWCIKNFLKQPLRTSIKRATNEIELVALHLYYSVASHMPVTVRKWYNNNSNKRLCNLVNEYTVKHISQVICSQEMDSVQEKCQERAANAGEQSKNLIIKARPSAKEVYAMYTRDEFKMELTIKLPHNYPLGSVQIDAGKRVGVTDNKWRSWLLQLTTFLAHQNGPILDGVDLWRRNIDKRFEGVEKCTICYSILHSNYQLPKKRCQTCANMFHNLCLYKWFESSGNSTCPLCRNAW